MALLLLTMVVVFSAIAARLVSIQAVSAKHYLAVGLSQRLSTQSLSGQRGTIFDRQGDELAVSIPESTITADPRLVTDPEKEAAILSPLLGMSIATLQSELRMDRQFVYLARKIDNSVGAKIESLKLAGITTTPEPKRFDPAGSLASSLLGTVGLDNTGLSGLEQKYNAALAGRPGKLIQEVDPNGSPIPGGYRQDDPAVNGQDLVLTIDESLQEQTEQALAAQIVATKAKSGMAAVMDTQTGELVAVASLDGQVTCAKTTATPTPPSCPPATSPGASPFTNVFEPGSMSKLVTISSALQDGVIVPSEHFSVADTLPLAGSTFHDAESHPVVDWSVTDILANSSNVGTIGIAQRLGQQRLDDALSSYGFGQETAVRFPGESAGLVPPVSQWSDTSIATIAIGQGVAVTAIQMLAAYNTIANGGIYVAPKLVAATVDSAGQTIATPPSATHRVVSPQVAAEMNTMLGEVVRVGTGQTAKINGYTVAGKTGTALIPLQDARGYTTGVYASSFAGFVPAEHPDLTAIVVLDQTPLFGAVAAAPAFATIAGDALRDFEIAPVAPQPPAPGVPLATPETAQAAGETLGPVTAAVKLPPVTKASTDTSSRSTTTSTTAAPAAAATPPRRNGPGNPHAGPGSASPTTTSLPAKR